MSLLCVLGDFGTGVNITKHYPDSLQASLPDGGKLFVFDISSIKSNSVTEIKASLKDFI